MFFICRDCCHDSVYNVLKRIACQNHFLCWFSHWRLNCSERVNVKEIYLKLVELENQRKEQNRSSITSWLQTTYDFLTNTNACTLTNQDHPRTLSNQRVVLFSPNFLKWPWETFPKIWVDSVTGSRNLLIW